MINIPTFKNAHITTFDCGMAPNQADAEKEQSKIESEVIPAFESLDIGALFAKRRAEKKAAKKAAAAATDSME